MISFASNATVDVAINYNFITPITNAVKTMKFGGATFGPGGLTLAQNQNDSVPILAAQNATKVVVYFTDGHVNTIQDTFHCTSALGPTLYNYGGYDELGQYLDFFNPLDGTDWEPSSNSHGLDVSGYPRTSRCLTAPA